MAGAKLNISYKTLGKILNSEAGRAKLREAAAKIAQSINDPETRLEEYTTDRAVVGVMVPADKQAKHGIATRAANEVAGS